MVNHLTPREIQAFIAGGLDRKDRERVGAGAPGSLPDVFDIGGGGCREEGSTMFNAVTHRYFYHGVSRSIGKTHRW